MSQLKNNFSNAMGWVGSNFANPLATVLGRNKGGSNTLDDLNFKLSNPVGQVGSVGRDIIQKHNPAPPPVPAQVVPMPDQEEIDRAARRARQKQLGRSGFASTILSAASGTQQTSDRLGP